MENSQNTNQPIAWMAVFSTETGVTVDPKEAQLWKHEGYDVEPLYLAPPSSAQTDQVWNEACEALKAKLVDRMHAAKDSTAKAAYANAENDAHELKRASQVQEHRRRDFSKCATLDDWKAQQEPASPAAQSGAVDDPISLALDALKANHQHHQDYDEHDGYPESELCEQNTKAIATLSRAQTAPAHVLPDLREAREALAHAIGRYKLEHEQATLDKLDRVIAWAKYSAPAPVSEQPAAQTAGVPEGWKIVKKATCYALICDGEVIASLAGPQAAENAVTLSSLLAAPQPVAEQADNPDELEPPELLASRLLNAWCDHHGRQIPWAKAIEITAIVTRMPDDEKQRLLALDDDDSALPQAAQANGGDK